MTNEELVKQLRTASVQADDMRLRDFGYLMKTAAEAIEELNDIARTTATIIENEKDMRVIAKDHRWIPVTERLPEGGWHLVVCDEPNGSIIRKAVYDDVNKVWLERQINGLANIRPWVTHWMPLPEPPKGVDT